MVSISELQLAGVYDVVYLYELRKKVGSDAEVNDAIEIEASMLRGPNGSRGDILLIEYLLKVLFNLSFSLQKRFLGLVGLVERHYISCLDLLLLIFILTVIVTEPFSAIGEHLISDLSKLLPCNTENTLHLLLECVLLLL